MQPFGSYEAEVDSGTPFGSGKGGTQEIISPSHPGSIQPVKPDTGPPEGTVKFITGFHSRSPGKITTTMPKKEKGTDEYKFESNPTTLKSRTRQPNIVHPTLIPFDFTPTLPPEEWSTGSPSVGIPIPIIPVPIHVFTTETRQPWSTTTTTMRTSSEQSGRTDIHQEEGTRGTTHTPTTTENEGTEHGGSTEGTTRQTPHERTTVCE